jgi:excinuclease ABC subunit B
MFDVLIGVNLLREGLDLPEVALVAIMDADKEGFLRSARALTQTAGRAARHASGNVIMYADRHTDSMQEAIAESNRRREKQLKFNREHNITPRAAQKSSKTATGSDYFTGRKSLSMVADVKLGYTGVKELERAVAKAKSAMEESAKRLDFLAAAQHRDAMYALQERLEKIK